MLTVQTVLSEASTTGKGGRGRFAFALGGGQGVPHTSPEGHAFLLFTLGESIDHHCDRSSLRAPALSTVQILPTTSRFALMGQKHDSQAVRAVGGTIAFSASTRGCPVSDATTNISHLTTS